MTTRTRRDPNAEPIADPDAAREAALKLLERTRRTRIDLERRLLRYPCSYMVYSAAFTALPRDVRGAILGRVWDVLSGRDASPKYARLSEADRRAVVGILRETLPDLPGDFGATAQ